MSTKFKVSVEDGASHSLNVSINQASTGGTLRSQTVDAGGEESFEIDDNSQVVIQSGTATPESEDAAEDTASKKK